jgi:SAM-dependent methyltransferase
MTEWGQSGEDSPDVIDFFEKHDYEAFWKERRLEDAAQKHVLGSWIDAGAMSVELGGGFGRITKFLEPRFATSVLVDLSDRNLDLARRYLDGTALAKADVAMTPFRDSTFDCVVMVRVAHLLSDPAAVLSEVQRIAKDGATVIVSIPNQAMINAFITLSWLAHLGRRRRDEPGFIPATWPYGDRSYLLSPMSMFPPSFKLRGRRGTGLFENPVGRRLSGHRRLYLLDVATSPLWMFKFEILLRFEVRKTEVRPRTGSQTTREAGHTLV